MKTCTKCNEEKSLEEFHRCSATKDGHQRWCKACVSAYNRKRNAERSQEGRDQLAAQGRGYYAAHREKINTRRRRNRDKDRQAGHILKSTYGITLEDYGAILESQGRTCAICGRTPEENGKRLAVDHDHETGEVRGLLCVVCNIGIGMFQDSPEICNLAAQYLAGYSGKLETPPA